MRSIYSNEKNQINVTPQLKESVKLPGKRSNMNAKSIKMSNYLVLKLCTGPFLCLIFIQPMSFTSSVVGIRFIVIQMIAPNLLHAGSTTFGFLSFSNIEEPNVAIGKYHSFLRKRKWRNVAHFNNHSNKNYTCLCLQLKIVKYWCSVRFPYKKNNKLILKLSFIFFFGIPKPLDKEMQMKLLQ